VKVSTETLSKLAKAVAGGALIAVPIAMCGYWRTESIYAGIRERERAVIDAFLAEALGRCRGESRCVTSTESHGERCARQAGRYRSTYIAKGAQERELSSIDGAAFERCIAEAR